MGFECNRDFSTITIQKSGSSRRLDYNYYALEGADMGRKTRDEWLRDVYARQRNVVFPDTVQNEGRFWRNIVEGRGKLTWVQILGIVLVVGMLAFCVALMGKWGLALVVGAVLLSLWLNRKEWQKRNRS